MLRRNSKMKQLLRNCIASLRCPNNWIHALCDNKINRRALLLGAVLFMTVGMFLNNQWHFPYFPIFSLCFLFIGVLGLWSVSYYSKKMEQIIAAVANQPSAKKANLFYFRHSMDSVLYIMAPLTIIFIFGLGCCSMFGAIQLTPTFVWMIVLFITVVYVSIIGYLQYLFLTIYICNLAHGSGDYRNLPKSAVECIPAQLEWVQMLTKLSHTYRSAFFTLGSAYIMGYSAFCWLPEMQANTSSLAFILLWGIIFLAIVFLFPIVSILEYQWIKMLIEQLKICYIKDLVTENAIKAKGGMKSSPPAIQRLVQTLCATQILNSKDYPLRSIWETSYAALLSALNFAAAVTTIIQCIPIHSSVLLRIL